MGKRLEADQYYLPVKIEKKEAIKETLIPYSPIRYFQRFIADITIFPLWSF